jgi:hypothetical protein
MYQRRDMPRRAAVGPHNRWRRWTCSPWSESTSRHHRHFGTRLSRYSCRLDTHLVPATPGRHTTGCLRVVDAVAGAIRAENVALRLRHKLGAFQTVHGSAWGRNEGLLVPWGEQHSGATQIRLTVSNRPRYRRPARYP